MKYDKQIPELEFQVDELSELVTDISYFQKQIDMYYDRLDSFYSNFPTLQKKALHKIAVKEQLIAEMKSRYVKKLDEMKQFTEFWNS